MLGWASLHFRCTLHTLLKGRLIVAGVSRDLREVPAFASDIQTQKPHLPESQQDVPGDTQQSFMAARPPGSFLPLGTGFILCS